MEGQSGRGQQWSEGLIMPAEIIIGLTGNKDQEMMREREEEGEIEDKVIAGECVETRVFFLLPLSIHPFPHLPFSPQESVHSSRLSSFSSSSSSSPFPLLFPEHVDGTLPQCQPSLSLSPSESLCQACAVMYQVRGTCTVESACVSA